MSYEDQLERFYRKLDLSGATVIDVGANVGRHAIPLAKLVGVGGTVHAFEPVPLIRAKLNDNLAAEHLNNVVVYPFALSAARAVEEFNFVPNLPEESGLKRRHIYNGIPAEFLKIRVGVMRLDDVIPATCQVSFVKIDVEGGELDVLRGAGSVLRVSRPLVAFECGAASYLGYHNTPGEIFKMFASLGFAVYSLTGILMQDEDQFVEASVAQAFWDYVAVPAERNEVAAILKAGV